MLQCQEIDVIKKEAEKILRPYSRNSVHVECESRSDTGNRRGNWNHPKLIKTMSEQHTEKA